MWLLPVLILIVIGAGLAAAILVSVADTFTVTFDSNGGTAVASQTVNEGDAATEPEDPTRDGYEFVAWYLDGEEYDFSTSVTSDITLVAQWEEIVIEPEVTYTVTFDSNGGTEVASQTVNEGGTATEPEEPTLDGYIFLGWYLDGSKYYFSAPVTADITLVARWTEVTEMLVALEINTDNVKTAYTIGDEFDAEGLAITATLQKNDTLTEYEETISPDSEYITIDSSAFDSSSAGTYTIYIGCTLNGYTRWASYDVTVTSAISGVHAIELSLGTDGDANEITYTTYNVATGESDLKAIDLSGLTVYSVNEDGTLGGVITEGITYKYFVGSEEVSAEELNNSTVRTFQIWAYADYTVGNETYVMSDFVLVEIIGNLIDGLAFFEGTTTQAQSYTDDMSLTWVVTADYSLTGAANIKLSTAEVGTEAGQYTVTNLITSITGTRTATLTYYYLVGTEVMSVSCEVSYTITAATEEGTFSAIIDVNAGTDDGENSYAKADYVITSVADGDEIVASMVYSNGLSGVNSENKYDANGENRLYGRIQFGTSKGVTLYLAGPATITLYARYGSSGGDGAQFVLCDVDGNIVNTSDTISDTDAYEIVTVSATEAGEYTLFASSGSLNTFRIEIEGTIETVEVTTVTLNANDLAEDVGEYSEEKALNDTFAIVAASGSTVKIDNKTSEPVTIGDETFNYAINLGGSKKDSGNARSIMFTITEDMLTEGTVTITVYANHGGGAGSERTLAIYTDGKSGSNYVTGVEVDGEGAVVELTISEAGTYYLGSKSSGINIYKIVISQGEV